MTTDQLDAAIAATQRLAASTAHRLALEHLIPDDATPETMRALVAAILDDAGSEIAMCEEAIATWHTKHADFVREARHLAELAGVQNVDALGDSVIVQRTAIAIGQTTTRLADLESRLRAKLVAPVDPEAVAGKALIPIKDVLVGELRAAGSAVRAYLVAAGIPVTPEAGK